MNEEQRRKIENHLRVIQLAVTQLLDLLPEEQSHVGSELQKIESLKNALYHKYVREGEAKIDKSE
jgi:phage-related protein